VFEEAGLPIPSAAAYMHTGGKTGTHTEYLGHILSQLQFMQRAYPGMEW
ncbi:MAG TPA: phenylacetate-CoA oxygenase subunit PaaI, partial [Chitinophagaceae bacterium]|nr:phenylacetate-CoA oxygenase subunit PaaI [Chitinophagaceae bacterium]